MTVLSTTAKAGPYAGAGTTGPFAVPFRFLESAHLRVIRTAAGVETVLTLGADYTVSGAGASSGSVTLTTALPVGQTLTVIRAVPATQEADYVPGDAFPAESHEQALDKLTMIAQQQGEEIARSVRVNASSTQTPEQLLAELLAIPDKSAAAVAVQASLAMAQAQAAAGSAAAAAASYDQFDDRYLGAKNTAPTVDNDGNPLIVGTVYWDTPSSQMFTWNGASWRPAFLIGNTVRTVVTATAGQTVVPAPTYLVGSNTIQVFVNGIKVLLGTDYTETTQNSITFATGLTVGDEVELIAQQAFAVDELRADLAASTAGKGADMVAFKQSGTGAAPTTVQDKLRDIMAGGQVLLRPVYLDQFIDGFFGRGMLTDETDNVVTEQFLTASASAGAGTISVTSATNFLIGGCVTVKHDNGRYGTYFVANKSGNVLTIFPSLRHAVSTASKIERTWFNRAHPGKFYMRELAQRIARTTELEAAMPSGGRVLFTNFSSDPNTVEDSLVSVAGGAVYYFAASNVGSSDDITTPVRFAIGRTAYVESPTVGSGAETRLFAVRRDTECVAKIIFAATSGTPTYKIEVLDETGKAFNEVLATYNAPNGANSAVLRTYTIPFNTRTAKYLKVRVTCLSSPNGAFMLDQVDVFEAPATNGLIISKRGAKIVCIGDSWVAGDLTNTPEREPITAQLAAELPDATIINAGIGGNKIWEQVARFDADVAVHKPDYVVVNTGTNEAYSPASAVFDPNAIDYFIYQYRLMINKIIGIGAKPIILGVPALAQSDAGSGYTNWLVNDRARGYVKAFYEWQGVRPLALGAHSGLESYRTDALLTSGSTPSVAYMRRIDLEYSSATTITNLLNGVSGQVVTLVARNSNVTLEHGLLLLDGAANVTLTDSSTITLMRLDTAYSSGWVEIGRSIVQPKAALEITLTSGTTPSVAGARFVNLDYGSATTITNFTGGTTNQEVQVRALNGNVTLNHSVFQLVGAANVTLTNNSVITLRKLDTSQTSAWVEVSRSIK